MPNHFPWYLKSHGIQVKSQEIKKKDNIEAIFRKCKKKDPTNYQLVSRSSVLRKIMEQILLGTTLRHMENRDVISDSWHSFTKGKSCLTNLAAFLVEGLQQCTREGLQMSCLWISIRPFGHDHNILLSKLERDGFDG